ncbi:hypothetical protein FVE85_1280 [Porphyridium purpureum]|uniref:Polyphosphate kinase-2-related domain-containing protein n=1 Tax=Porphyridium purpureum TaxID=35688 RepID=A0A5J4YJI5_PORPP|nr:hypothetical protein FVE85_1280 [Porphyridium purpureum]|eukprot:POR5831..scf251_18
MSVAPPCDSMRTVVMAFGTVPFAPAAAKKAFPTSRQNVPSARTYARRKKNAVHKGCVVAAVGNENGIGAKDGDPGSGGDDSYLSQLSASTRVENGTDIERGLRDEALNVDTPLRTKEMQRMLKSRLAEYQTRMLMTPGRSVLVIVQGYGFSGKASSIRAMSNGMNPSGVTVTSFGVPVDEELDFNFLWRYHRAAPRAGQVAFWNRSYFEDVVTASVKGLVSDAQARKRCEMINEFEKILERNGTAILKVFLNVSLETLFDRVEARAADPRSAFLSSPEHLDKLTKHAEYRERWKRAIAATSTPQARWHIVPSDEPEVRDLACLRLLLDLLERHVPPVSGKQQAITFGSSESSGFDESKLREPVEFAPSQAAVHAVHAQRVLDRHA